MNDTTVTDVLAVPVAQKQAMDLHLRIKSNLEMTATSLTEVCRGLKEMKEGERYKELGFESFEAYTESALGIKSRMAYYYISTYERLGPELLAENAGLGITKLRLLSEVTPFNRDSFMEDNDLANMSTEEIKQAIKERDGLREQLSLYTEPQRQEEESDQPDAFTYLRQELEAAQEARRIVAEELATLQAAQPDVDALRKQLLDEIGDAMVNEAVAEARADTEKETAALLKVAKKEATEKAEKAGEKRLEAARTAALEEGRKAAQGKMEAKLAQERAETEKAAARAAELEKKLDVSSSTETTAFALHFDQLQQHFAKMVGLLETLQQKDAPAAEKLSNALEKGMDALKAGWK